MPVSQIGSFEKNIVLPSGIGMQFTNEQEYRDFVNQGRAQGAQDTADVQQQAQDAGRTLDDQRGQMANQWYTPGNQGYDDVIRGGHNDPWSDPTNPAMITPDAVSARGFDPRTYYDQNIQQAGTPVGMDAIRADWGYNVPLNQALTDFVQSRGLNPNWGGFGEGQFQQWLRYQDPRDIDAIERFIASYRANNPTDPGQGGGGGGGYVIGGSGGGGLYGDPGSYTRVSDSVQMADPVSQVPGAGEVGQNYGMSRSPITAGDVYRATDYRRPQEMLGPWTDDLSFYSGQGQRQEPTAGGNQIHDVLERHLATQGIQGLAGLLPQHLYYPNRDYSLDIPVNPDDEEDEG